MHIVENCAVHDVTATGMAEPEYLGYEMSRYTFYIQRRSLYDRSDEAEVVCRLVMPNEVARASIGISMPMLGIRAACSRCCLIGAH